MNVTLGLSLLLLAGLLIVEGLLKPNFPPKHHEVVNWVQEGRGRKAAQELAVRNMNFGFKLYTKLASINPCKNIFFSPASISIAFAVLGLGAQNSTLAEMKQTFNFRNMPEREIREGFHYLIQRLNQENENLQLYLNTILFIDQGLQPEKKFMENAKNLYNADSVPTNFQNLENARKYVNDYVSKATKGKINNLIMNINPGTLMLLVNCIFFRARWKHEFDPKSTKEDDFMVDENRPVKVPMMFRGGMYKVGYDDQLPCTILEMPYYNNFTALFILPHKGEMKKVEEALRPDTFERWKKLLTKRIVDVFLPRFSITGTYNLKRVLSNMGITKIFEEQGDLTRIVPNQNLKLGEAVHKAQVKMDEKGTEGTASSGMQTLPMERPLVFKLNRPFLVMITENVTPTMIFLGKIINPTGT